MLQSCVFRDFVILGPPKCLLDINCTIPRVIIAGYPKSERLPQDYDVSQFWQKRFKWEKRKIEKIVRTLHGQTVSYFVEHFMPQNAIDDVDALSVISFIL